MLLAEGFHYLLCGNAQQLIIYEEKEDSRNIMSQQIHNQLQMSPQQLEIIQGPFRKGTPLPPGKNYFMPSIQS